jgi:murein DD-endopeptidase MepM/ murein hydrolase activator NlpD
VNVRAILAVVGLLLATSVPASAQDLPDAGRIGQLRGDERSLQIRLREARAKLDAMVETYESARTEFGTASQRLWQAERDAEALAGDLRAARAQLGDRATAMYTGRRLAVLDAMLNARSMDEFLRVFSYMTAVLNDDATEIRRIESQSADASVAIAALDAERAATRSTVREMDVVQNSVLAEMAEVQRLLKEIRATIVAEAGKFQFPVHPPYSFTDSWGAPRMHGTRFAHAHEGTDIFAPRGTPVVAVVPGVVERVGERGLGGKSLYLRSQTGHRYYYAHLDGYAETAVDGTVVEAAAVLGYVGDTGNARGGLPHLHFEIHLPGGGPINPYPTLKAADTGWAG